MMIIERKNCHPLKVDFRYQTKECVTHAAYIRITKQQVAIRFKRILKVLLIKKMFLFVLMHAQSNRIQFSPVML